MTLVQAPTAQKSTARCPRRVAVIPAYNEEGTIVSVLERLAPLADDIIIVDDGSRDRTLELVLEWSAGRANVRLISFPRNRGMSAAYYRAFEEVKHRVLTGRLSTDDVVLTIDADGQHDPAEVDTLVEYLVDKKLDAVIARRELSNYSLYKRVGNWIMSFWASLWAGRRLDDVESGYRAFRVGALLAALAYYRGYKYSETVEVAVILARLGYRVDNSYRVPVPIFRSNTRLRDLVIDLLAMPAAYWRVTTQRSAPPGMSRKVTYSLPLVVPALALIIAIDLLKTSLFLASDSMQHYSHVWYVSDQLFHHARLPLHLSLLDGGRAMTFPYGAPQYVVAAVLRPLLGERATTVLLLAGVFGLVWSACLARPLLRDPWFLILFCINPFFLDAVFSFQLVSVWSLLFFFLFVWRFEANRWAAASVLLGLSVATHPVMGLSSVALYAAYLALASRRTLRKFLPIAVMAVAASAPFTWMSLQTPALGESSLLQVALSVGDTVGRRGTMLVLPLALPYLGGWLKSRYSRALPAFGLASLAGLVFSAGVVHVGGISPGTYAGAFHTSRDIYGPFFTSDAFQVGATYRLLEPTEREDGMYRFMKHGAVLANEFFTESQMRRTWTEAQFACYAAFKQIDFEVVEKAYDLSFHKNEGALLREAVSSGIVSLAYADPRGRFDVFDLRKMVASRPRPGSLRECDL